jgi:hypothetical protein
MCSSCRGCFFDALWSLRWRKERQLIFLTALDLAAQYCAVFNDDAPRLHIPCNSARTRNLDPLAFERSNYFAVHDNFAGFYVCVNPPVGSYSETPIVKVNFSFERAIQEEILPAGDFPLDPYALADTS